MKDTLAQLQDQIAARRGALLQEYSEYDLHQLRVAVRRLRGLLRFEAHPDAWQLRKEWGFLISQTNPARDWDTLFARIEELPEDQQPVGLLSAVERHQQKVWNDVISALRNAQWEATARRQQAYTESHIEAERAPLEKEKSIGEASMRVNLAWDYAEKHDEPRAWHKLRIAIKDLRYSLDSLSQTEVDEPIELCKRLQDLLGSWHDSIIHRDLLKRVDADLAQDEKAAKDAVAELDTDLFAEGMKALKETRHVMAARQQLLERARKQ
ncbi:MAG: CHAD domain-containing protein [Halieaceae bacterium]|jgi:CHAD domain-containing protein|nr:CHAD domain-containing protein [Halieaceae bacterium]